VIRFQLIKNESVLYEVSDMKNLFRHILSKMPILFAGLVLSAVFTLSNPTDATAGDRSGTVNASSLGDDEAIVLTGDLTIEIDADKTIGNITHAPGNEHWNKTYTLTIKDDDNSGETLTCGTIITEDDSYDHHPCDKLVMQGGNFNTKTIQISEIEIRGGCLTTTNNADYSEIMKARHNDFSGTSGNITITGGTVNVDNSQRAHAIFAVRNLNISGRNTVVMAKSGSGDAIHASSRITISSPLIVSTPEGGGISESGRFIATRPSGGESEYAKEVVIQKGPESSNTGDDGTGSGGTEGGSTGGTDTSSKSDDDKKENEQTPSNQDTINNGSKDVSTGGSNASSKSDDDKKEDNKEDNKEDRSDNKPESSNQNTKAPDGCDELRSQLSNAIASELKTSVGSSGGKSATVYWDKSPSLPADVMQMLHDNPNVTVVFSCTYNGVPITVTIPGSAVVLNPAVQWYGPLYLYALYGNVKIPALTTNTGTSTDSYKVQSGDSLSSIAKKNHTTVEHLQAVNHITDPNKIKPGMVLTF
jgi:LysM repeat protein